LSTKVNLARRGVVLSNTLCPMCNKVEETTQHVLINCELAQKVWDECDRWIGITT